MSDETQKAARVIARDLLNAVSEGLDIAGTVDSVVHKVAAIGGAVDTAIQKYGLDSGQIAALAVLMDQIEIVEPTAIDYASIEKRIAAEWYGSVTGRSMELTPSLSVMVGGVGLGGWREANALFSMMSPQAREGLAEYFVEHGVKPIDEASVWPSKTIVAALLAHATLDTGLPPEIIAAQCGTLAFLALVRHSEELSAMDGVPNGFVDMAGLHSPTTRNAFEPEQQQLPGNPILDRLLQNPDFRMESVETGRLPAEPNQSNVPKDGLMAQCMRCHDQVVIKDVEVVTAPNGRRQAKGICPVCGTKLSKFLPKVTA